MKKIIYSLFLTALLTLNSVCAMEGGQGQHSDSKNDVKDAVSLDKSSGILSKGQERLIANEKNACNALLNVTKGVSKTSGTFNIVFNRDNSLGLTAGSVKIKNEKWFECLENTIGKKTESLQSQVEILTGERDQANKRASSLEKERRTWVDPSNEEVVKGAKDEKGNRILYTAEERQQLNTDLIQANNQLKQLKNQKYWTTKKKCAAAGGIIGLVALTAWVTTQHNQHNTFGFVFDAASYAGQCAMNAGTYAGNGIANGAKLAGNGVMNAGSYSLNKTGSGFAWVGGRAMSATLAANKMIFGGK